MYEGEGKVLDAHTVALTTPDGEVKHFTAKHILIATGGRAVLLDIPGKVGDSKETGLCFYVMCVPCAKFLWLRLMVCLHHLQ
jgi:pyruvate/2-oxoglutarate dehydrogenase complex dihydrolipoamide dehydrogenase (E3) component